MLRTFATGVSLAAVVALAGCSSSSGNKGDTSTPPSPKPTSSVASTTTRPTPVTQPSSVPVSVPNKSGVIANRLVAVTSCKAVTGGWQAAGTAKGAGGKAAKYTVTVFFTTKQATVQAYGSTKVDVAAGKSGTWTVTSTFKAAPGTLCVLRGAG